MSKTLTDGVETGETTFLGLRMQQNELAPSAFDKLIREVKPTRILEVGTGTGGLTALLRMGCENVVTYDTRNIVKYPERFKQGGIDFRNKSVFEDLEEVKKFIQRSGTTLVLCDGDNKPKEFKTLAAFLKPGDVIAAHDYRYDPNTWAWSQIDDDVLTEDLHLRGFFMEQMGPAAWMCCKRLKDDEKPDVGKLTDGKVIPQIVYIKVCSIRNPDVKQMESIFGTWFTNARNIKVALGFEGGDSLICRARSIVASEFLKSDGDILLFIDDDIIWDPDAISMIAEDVRDLKTVVCGAYMVKSVREKRLALNYLNDDPISVGPKGGLVEVLYASAGFMAIPRKVLEDVAKTLPLVDGAYGVDGEGKPRMMFYPMFQPIYPEGVYLSEDYSFCHRAKECGYKIYVDSRITLGHRGMVTFVGGSVE